MKFKLNQQDGQGNPVSRLVEEIESALMAAVVPMETIYAVNLCVEELVVNIVNHGYGGEAVPDVEVHIELEPDRLIIDISDGAPPFDPITEVAEPDIHAELEQRSIGGLGIHLVKRLTDGMRYRRLDGRNQVRLIKTFKPEDDSED